METCLLGPHYFMQTYYISVPVEAHPSELVQIDKRFIPGLLIRNVCFPVNLRKLCLGADVKCRPIFIYLFVCGCAGSFCCGSFLPEWQQVGVPPGCNTWPLIAVASVVAERWLGAWASAVAVRGLSCPEACGIFLEGRVEPVSATARWVLYHQATRSLNFFLFKLK